MKAVKTQKQDIPNFRIDKTSILHVLLGNVTSLPKRRIVDHFHETNSTNTTQKIGGKSVLVFTARKDKFFVFFL